ncbi:MAG TPA: hypothetical protein VGZ25_04435 [Gemmataceae bacterium]|nr:hypothetical protein [Gemmataceae bacterium]
MTRTKSYSLTDIANDVWLDSFSVGNDSLRLPTPHSRNRSYLNTGDIEK